MQQFTGLEYLKIDVANCFGMDKVTWQERLDWFDKNKKHLEDRTGEITPKKQILYKKGVIAYRRVMEGDPTGHIMYLDATSSGYQHMAALSGCKQTALATNMLDPDIRYDLYKMVADDMNKELPLDQKVTRDLIKKPVMTNSYNKQSQETLSDIQEAVFNKVLKDRYPGKDNVMAILNKCWDWGKRANVVIMPDKHVAYIPVIHKINTKIEVDELDHSTFAYRYGANISDNERPWYCIPKKAGLVPNIIHIIDAYAARMVIRKCKVKGVDIVTIHDAFGFFPPNGNTVRQAYIDAMINIAQSDLLQNIINQLGLKGRVNKLSYDLPKYIQQSNYMLS